VPAYCCLWPLSGTAFLPLPTTFPLTATICALFFFSCLGYLHYAPSFVLAFATPLPSPTTIHGHLLPHAPLSPCHVQGPQAGGWGISCNLSILPFCWDALLGLHASSLAPHMSSRACSTSSDKPEESCAADLLLAILMSHLLSSPIVRMNSSGRRPGPLNTCLHSHYQQGSDRRAFCASRGARQEELWPRAALGRR